jgi:hypothetical protein
MRVDLYGLSFETAGMTFYLWSPWRAAAIEHRLFDAVRQLPQAETETSPDEHSVNFKDPKPVRLAFQAVERILKGWQEEASDAGGDRRIWRWLIEADTDAAGYDHTGDRASIWGFLRLSLERNAPGEGERGEDIDMNGFGFRVWNADEK